MDPSALTGYCNEAVVAYARGLFDTFQSTNSRLMVSTRDRWRRGPDGFIRPTPTDEFTLALFTGEYDGSHPAEASAARDAIDADPDFGDLLGGLVGTDSGASAFNYETILNGAAAVLVGPDGNVAFDAGAIRGAVDVIRTFVRASERIGTAIIPLPGLKSDRFPILLEEGIEIDELSDDEVEPLPTPASFVPHL